MSYIVCDKCGGYYELQPGESPEDFESKCECKGNLKYVQNLNPNAQDLKPFNTRFMELLNWKAIAAGCIVFAAAFITQGILIGDTKTFYAPDNIIFLEALIGGIAVGCVADPEYRTGIFNGLLYGLIVRLLLLTFIIVVVAVFPYSSPFYTLSMVISGSAGALIGTSFKKLIKL